MTHWYKYFILLLIPIVFGCGSNSSDNTQNDAENEDFQISDVGDINGDGIQDSVVLEMMSVTNVPSTDGEDYQDNEGFPVFLFSLYLGKGNNQYEQIKQCVIPYSSTESGISISKPGRLVIGIEHLIFEYAFRDNELYLEKHERCDVSEPCFSVDFIKNEVITAITPPFDDTSFTMPIPEGRRPSIMETNIKQSMSRTFREKYLYYGEAFYDSLFTLYKEISTGKMSVVDNDTLLEMKAVMGRNAVLKLSFLKKGLSKIVINAIEQDFLNQEFLKSANRYSYSIYSDSESSEDTSFEDVFYKSKEDWKKENAVGLRDDKETITPISAIEGWSRIYLIKPIYENDHFVSCLFNYVSDNCSSCCYSYIITYDKETTESFSWDMIRKNDEFLALLKAHILESRSDVNEEKIKYSECPPFIENDSLRVTYQYYEITDAHVDGRPGATIPLDEIEPYLTEEGRRFLRR